MNRPLVWVALAIAAGSYTVQAFSDTLVYTGVFFFLCLALAGLFHGLRRASEPSLIIGVFFVVGVAVAIWHAPSRTPSALEKSAPDSRSMHTLSGKVLEAALVSQTRTGNIQTAYQQFVARVDAPDGPTKVLVRWSTPGGSGVVAGETVTIRGRLTSRLGTCNFAVSEAEDYYNRRGIRLAALAKGPEAVKVTGRDAWSVWYWADRLRRAEADLFRRVVPESAQPFVIAAWLGERGQLRGSLYNDFVLSGTAHILAVSGINVTILYAGLAYVLRLFGPRRKFRAYAALAAVCVFALTSGAQVSVLRASIMIALYLAADLLDREPDTASALSLSAILFLLIQPALIFDPGFLLSFCSVASILVFLEPLQQRMGAVPYGIREGLGMSLSAQILPFPIAARLMNCLPVISPLTNLVAVPLFSAILWLTFVTLATGFVWEHAALIPGHALGALVAALESVVHYSAQFPLATIRLTSPQPVAMIAFWCAALIGAYALRRSQQDLSPRRAWNLAALCLLVSLVLWRPFTHEAAVDFLDVGHGDATIIQTGDGRTALVDAGDKTPNRDMGESVVARALWARGITKLDAVVVSHTDRDHIGGMTYILRNFEVGRLVISRAAAVTPAGLDLQFVCQMRNIPVAKAVAGDVITLGETARLNVLHPPPDWPKEGSVNDGSLVARLDWRGPGVLFAGDVEAEAEKALAALDCKATVLKVPHHASHTSSSEAFLRAVAPSVAIVSTGGMAGREPADPAVLERFAKMGITTIRTDVEGGIRLSPGSGEALFHTARHNR